MELTLRYQAMHSTGPDDNVEANIVPTELRADLDPAETALVLVDTWGEHPIASHRSRTSDITVQRIRPALDAARAAGVTPIYAPSPAIAATHPQWSRWAGVEELHPTPEPDDGWPPAAYRAVTGPYESLRRAPGELPPDSAGKPPEPWHRFRTIHDAVAPEPDDIVIATGEQLQRALRDLRLVHLLYVGFATNICVRFRDYGIHAMRNRGYAPILLRDCTSGIETRETYDGLQVTDAVLHDLERWCFTADSREFIAACQSA
ncbi:MAG: isochorismatase family protein [Chloroflexi bacterium]|nr:isochorismatase family protein [Chloroflexota bacterium]